ncbi:D-alanyl-D-alanine carboxypeptidase/D-alanyl-D-alanine endopeptidase [Nocardioides humilatus]|uniref:D-alanyl-D-alanine carboxypeptidase/D-alanyl-D-alanine endopeptidase n=1 Tax=Nocardioides humilatus TaxID=2607660 RepID=UPI00165FF1D6|nr:D-alanyl-D-alanine carboxypeptidase/D-alanyl-D-alanine-endopeptidase [Nocardioides humilatus]
MAERDVDHVRGAVVGWVSAALALVLVLAVAGWQLGWLDGLGDDDAAPPVDDPAAVAPPPEVDVAPVKKPRAVAPVADLSPTLDVPAVEAALKRFLRDKDLGPHVVAAVEPLRGGGRGYEFASSGADIATPASTTKVVTSTVALSLLGPDHRFTTRTVLEKGATPRVVLVGGGDPFLLSNPQAKWGTNTEATFAPKKADVVTLAKATAKALRAQGVRRVRLAYDASLFSGPAVNPHWPSDYVPTGVVPPISALWIDEGRDPQGYGFSADPALTAAQVFGTALAKAGITVDGAATSTVADAAARDLASVDSAPLAQIVQRLLEVSDNEAAEVLLRQAGLAHSGDGSSVGGQAAVKKVLAAGDVDMDGSVLYDGSGLSRENLMSPHLLIDVLRWASSDARPELRAVLTGLPVAGFTGSLANRFDNAPADGPGRVRAKTGTLTGVFSLAGIAVDLDGSVLVFALIADQVPPARSGLAQIALDDAAAALGACHCTR